MLSISDPSLLAGITILAGFIAARYVKHRNSLAYFLVQLLAFVLLTSLLLGGGIEPYSAAPITGGELRRVYVVVLKIVWWLAAAWLAIGFLRAFVRLERQVHEARLVHDLLAALIYLAASFAIVAYVFDLPVKGLLATSGALAIIIGLALQSSLADVFSGIVLNIDRPYRVGDWIMLGDDVEGAVIETNWRATRILTSRQDVAIIPNSVIAKAKLINCSSPTKAHGASLRIKLEASLAPEDGRTLLKEVLLGSTHILRKPEPTVTIEDMSAEAIEFQLSYSVSDVGGMGRAKNELFDRVHRAVSAAGGRFAPRLARPEKAAPVEDTTASGVADRLLAGLSLFSTLTTEERASLASQMKRRDYKPEDILVERGSVVQALCIVSYGVLVISTAVGDRKAEVIRLVPGDMFGEYGLLTGETMNLEVTALTKAIVYEISKDALSPLLKARPTMVEELSESVASRQLALQALLALDRQVEHHEERLASRVAASIRHLFSLHN